jgi:cell division protein FtsB
VRLLIGVLAVTLVALQFRLWVSEGGIREVWRLEEQVASRTDENRRLGERNAALAAEVQDLKSGLAAAEERARSELGLVLPEESFYQIVPQDALPGLRAGAPSAPAQQDVNGAAPAVSSIR